MTTMMMMCGSRVHDGHDVLRSDVEHHRHIAGPGDAAVQPSRHQTPRLLNELHLR